ncbi:zinc ribbon domain-containing protein [Pseudomonas sp. Seg1]|uniref:zinc ribbon domain-containing protein n=1 Tax=Pseudomonas sp. Seg1 TaxID=2678259 RepID=UPI001BB453A8|nr:zinc ribbon domain-containing protein [Pseudomonas sp. Seg1]
MQIIIAVLLFLIAIYIVPWLLSVVLLALGAYAFVVVVIGGVLLFLLVAFGIWHGVYLLRQRAAGKRVALALQMDIEQSDAIHARAAEERERRAQIKVAEQAAEAERLNSERTKRSVPCPNCSSMILRGSMFCPACGKPPIRA